jgi:hypothetical protein
MQVDFNDSMDDFVVDDEEDASESSDFNVKQHFQRLVRSYENCLSLLTCMISNFAFLSTVPHTLLRAQTIVVLST